MTNHPLNELTVQDGNLIRRDPARGNSEYLDTPRIQVTAKKLATEMGSNEVHYAFDLNASTDATWVEIFLLHRGDTLAIIHGAKLEFRCIPANLESRYNRIKEAIVQTNDAYEAHKAALTTKVAELDVQRQHAAEAQAAHAAVVRDQFDKLQL
jgi:hypothetical protein